MLGGHAKIVRMRLRPSERSGAIDLVRVVAVAAIVAGHAWTREATAELLYTWHVPVFFLLSGYLWTHGRSMRDELGRRIRSLGRPYLAWLVLLTIALIIMRTFTGEPIIARIVAAVYGGAAVGQPYFTMWFVAALFFTVLLYRAIERLPWWAQWAIVAAGVVLAELFGPLLVLAPLGLGYAPQCLVFVLAGVGFQRLRARITRPLLTGLVLLGASAVMVALGWAMPLDLKVAELGTPVVSIAVACAISVGMVLVAEAIIVPGRFSTLLTLLAMPMLVVVLGHPMLLWVPVEPWAQFLLGVLVPLGVGLLVQRTPLGPWLTGQRRLVGPAAV